jgi:hypothetical protein
MALTKDFILRAGTLAAATHIAAASLPASAQVLPNIVSNTAQAEWTVGGQTLSEPSNTVDIAVDRSTPQPASLQVFSFSGGPNAIQTSVTQTMCRTASGMQPINLQGVFAGHSTSPASLIAATAIRAGAPLVLRVTANGQNINSGAIDSFEGDITTDSGDIERVVFTETAANSGIFQALVNTKAVPPAAVPGDCVLSVRPGGELHFDLDNATNGSPIASADVDILVDPFGLTFDSADGAAVNGTQVTIVDAATGVPAQVFGDDGVSSFPN